jgi:glycerophosphoryl diester phosphodiesterase
MAPWFARQQQVTTKTVTANAKAVDQKAKAKGAATPKSTKVRKKKSPYAQASLTNIITLDDLFERYGMTFSYNIEIKAGEERIPELALKTIREYGLKDNVTLTSFNVDQLSRARKLDADIPLCYLIDDRKTRDINAEIARAKVLGFNQVSIRAPVVSRELVKRAKDAGLTTISWGVQSDGDMSHAVQAGVSGMTTNWPDRLMKIIQTPISR